MSFAQRSLISDLESAIQSGSKADRIDTLRRITDLFLSTNDRLNGDQVDVFDEVLGQLVKRMEARALTELSERLAPIENAPLGVVRSLARAEEIAVAAPVLSMSKRLTSSDLVEIASTKGQAHLLAISSRAALEESVTDILVERGDLQVHRKLAGSPGARFSERGITHLVKSAEADDTLTERLGLRLDLPANLLRQLLAKASEIVRKKLMQLAPAAHRDQLHDILASIGDDVLEQLPSAPDFEYATREVQRLKANGQLDEVMFLQFVKSGHYAEWVVALGEMCSTPYDLLDRIFKSDRSEVVMVPCRAAGLSWLTVRAVLQSRSRAPLSNVDLEQLKADYTRLSGATAQRVLRFWCVQKVAGKDGFSG